MISSKTLIFLGLVSAFVLLVSSEVAARDLAETSTEKGNEAITETNGVEDAKHGGYDGGHGDRGGYDHGGRGGYDHGGRGGYDHGGRDGYDHGGGHGGGGHCRYGRCGYRCCSYAGEVVEGAKP